MSTETEMSSQPSQLVTIERAVAFVIGPVVVAGSAWLSAWLSTKVGIKVSPGEITGVAATGGIGAAGLIYKWLDGRSKHTLQEFSFDQQKAAYLLKQAGISPEDLENVAKDAADKAAQKISRSTEKMQGVNPGSIVPTDVPPVLDEPIVPSPIDPAPPTPIASVTVSQGPPAPEPNAPEYANATAQPYVSPIPTTGQ